MGLIFQKVSYKYGWLIKIHQKLLLKRADQIEVRKWTLLDTTLTGVYEWNPAL